jgi:g-D-glutamyl-meso-diaminopimelate peptidase
MIVDLDNPIYPYDKLVSDAKALAAQYDSILKCVTIGKSHDNRDIILLKLGLGKNYMVCCGGVHGRETINPVVLMRIIEFYAKLYVNHKRKREALKKQLISSSNSHLEEEYEQMLYRSCTYELLQTFTILFIPLLNPDGYMISLEGFDTIRDSWLKKLSLEQGVPAKEWKFNARGVDLNRNFPSRLWRARNKNDQVASENETKALIEVFHTYRPLGFLDFHSRGDSIYYYRNTMPLSYNERQLMIANKLKEITNYKLMNPEEEIEIGDSGGNTVHYFSEYFSRPALTIETVDENADFPLNPDYRKPVFENLKLVILEFGSLII